MPFVTGVLLAAGASRRLAHRHPKQLLPVEGEPLVRRIAKQALASNLCEVLVILGFSASRIEPFLSDLQIVININPAYNSGLSSSVKLGIQSLNPSAQAVIFIPGDQPFLSSEVINQLISKYEDSGARIVQPVYRKRRGSPLLFDHSLFPELLTIKGDEGGRQIIANHRQDLATVSLRSELPLLDVDTLEDYKNLIQDKKL